MFAPPKPFDVLVLTHDKTSEFARRILHAVSVAALPGAETAPAVALPAWTEVPDEAAFERLVQLMPGETVTERSVVVLDRDWHDFPAGTALYRRRSTFGDVFVGARPTTTQPAGLRASALAAGGGPGEDDIFGVVMSGSLTFAQFAGFALGGPAGLILAGGSAVLEQLFNVFGKRSSIPTAQIIVESMQRMQIAAEIQQALAWFRTVYQWFTEYYERDWLNTKDDPDELVEFKNRLSEVLGSNSNFLTYINRLEQSDIATDGFSVHMLSASFHLVLLMMDLRLKSTHKRMADVHAMTPLLDFGVQYIAYSKQTMATIADILIKRLGKITPVAAGASGTWYFVDKAETAENANGVVYKYDSKDDADMMREMHVTMVTARHDNQYYNGRPDMATQTIDTWQTNHDNLAAIKKKVTPTT